jgi:hypothetical protein
MHTPRAPNLDLPRPIALHGTEYLPVAGPAFTGAGGPGTGVYPSSQRPPAIRPHEAQALETGNAAPGRAGSQSLKATPLLGAMSPTGNDPAGQIQERGAFPPGCRNGPAIRPPTVTNGKRPTSQDSPTCTEVASW